MRRIGVQGVLLTFEFVTIVAGVAFQVAGNPQVSAWLWGGIAGVALAALLWSTGSKLRRGEMGVDVVAVLALAGSLALGEYLAGAIIGLMVASGRALEDFAAGRAERELSALIQRAPKTANRYEDGKLVAVAVETIRRGDRVLVKPGDVVPVDGIVQGGTAVLDESALTGEARPVEHPAGERIASGTVNAGPAFDLTAVASVGESTYAGIVRLVSEARTSKAPFARLADRYALAFVPITLAVAGITWLVSGSPVGALAVLVVATPCPLLLATPIAIVSGISRAASRGILIKNGGALEALARTRNVLFDKTGTLTMGSPRLAECALLAQGQGEDELLRLAASLDQVSSHVFAGAIVRAAHQRGLDLQFPTDASEQAGDGIEGLVGGKRIGVGRLDWVGRDFPIPPEAQAVRRKAALGGASCAFVAGDGRILGALLLDDPIRPDTPRTLRSLRRAGVANLVMVTGDHPVVADSIGAALGVDQVLAERAPADKVAAVQQARATGTTVMIGDGINDAPALAAADVGVAMGARGATSSSEAADVVLVADRLEGLAEGVGIAKHTMTIARQSALLGMGLSVGAMGLAAAGILQPLAGAFVQEGIDVLAILSALRALRGTPAHRARPVLDPAMAARLRDEHRELAPALDQLRAAADGLDALTPPEARKKLEEIRRFIDEVLLPHERADEREIYPHLARLMGGEDPLAAMSGAHQEIFRLCRLYGRVLDEMPQAGPGAADLQDLRRVLYGLHAILRLHFAQEQELYETFEAAPGAPPRVKPSPIPEGNQP